MFLKASDYPNEDKNFWKKKRDEDIPKKSKKEKRHLKK
jgi:hypothetical protein